MKKSMMNKIQISTQNVPVPLVVWPPHRRTAGTTTPHQLQQRPVHQAVSPRRFASVDNGAPQTGQCDTKYERRTHFKTFFVSGYNMAQQGTGFKDSFFQWVKHQNIKN